jgi:uncharacterized iron-regulated protein
MPLHPRCRSPAWLLAALLAVPAAPAQTAAEAPVHPLEHRIWNTRTQHFISGAELESGLQGARFVLLGEVHDNPGHLGIRRDLITALLRDGRRPAIAMEQFDREHQAALDRARSDAPRDAEHVKEATRFNTAGWDWPHYAPFVQLALDHELPLLAANLSRVDAFRVSAGGAAAVLGAAAVSALHLDNPLPDTARLKLERLIEEGHCGKAPPSILPGIVNAQRARDAIMAQALTRHAATGAVLIAGNGHVRSDFGVPHYLAQYAAGTTIAVVGLLEVRDGKTAPADYYAGDDPEYDFIAFTPRTPRPDPCRDIRFRPRPA